MIGGVWIVKITLFIPEVQWTEAAELPGIPGLIVAGLLGVFYCCIIALAEWPQKRQAKGEIYGEEPGEWKEE